MNRLFACGLTVAAVLWMAAILFVPVHVLERPHVLTAAVYAAGSVVCHQRPDRSFHVGGIQLPVCARCTGLYLSGSLAALIAWLGAGHVPRRTRAILIGAAVPTILTLVIEWARLGDPGNVARASAALPLGAAAGWLSVRLLRAERPQTICAMIS